MSWRMGITHTTRVRYHGSARASYNEARMTPLALPTQTTLDASLAVAPAASQIWSYRDYWGSSVSAFDIQASHPELAVTARATVETRAGVAPTAPPPWPALRARAAEGRLPELLAPTPRTTVTSELAAAAARRVAGADPLEAAAEIAEWVAGQVAYVPGATGVRTSAQEAWDQGQGVCQDIAHLTVALLRVVGLPARYVSGYLHPQPEARPGDTVAGQSHAWVEYWAGAWSAADPTNRAPVAERHVVVARGRDYADVAPLKGVYQGAPGGPPDVTVELTRLA